MNNQVQTRQGNPIGTLNSYFTKHKGQLAAALPKHLNPDRMIRLALTAFSQNKQLSQCTPESIFASVIVSSQLGLELGVAGQAFLVPYGRTCTCIPGWKGYVDLVSRSGRGSVWSAAVFEGDLFDWELGSAPFVRHKPCGESDPKKMTHVYAVGRVKDSDWPVIEVWPVERVWAHRDHYNKVGRKHYSFENPVQYARKIPLLRVIDYMPKSIELTAAQEIDIAASEGKGAEFINGEFVVVDNDPQEPEVLPGYPQETFDANLKDWAALVESGKKSADQIIATVETKGALSDEQKATIKNLKTEIAQ